MASRDVRVSWTRTVAPALEPITIEEAKAHARITDNQSDQLVDAYIRAAREEAEDTLNRGLYTQTWKTVADDFFDEFVLPMAAPLQSVTSVEYYDDNGTLQTLATTVYAVDTISRQGRITRKPDQSWPSLQADRLSGRVIVTYVVGWTSVNDIPERIKQGIRLWVTYLDADRLGADQQAETAKRSALACWTDIVHWSEPCYSRVV